MRPMSLMLIPTLTLLCSCGQGTENTIASSGDPEADRRAELRLGADPGAKNDGRTLYERLGGQDTIAALVDDTTRRVINDPRVNFERSSVRSSWLGNKYKPWDPTADNVARFKLHMVEFLSLASGGPATYTGRDMREVHKGMKISNTEFDAMVGDIKTSMDRLGIAPREKRDLMAIIETTRKEIVEKQ